MNYKQLTEVERYQIKAFLTAGYSKNMIAKELNRHPSTIGREIKRNTGKRGYRPKQANELANIRKSNHINRRISESTWCSVELLLKELWSPEQIYHWLKSQDLPTVSIEWIYQYILKDKLSGGELYTYLRCQRKRKKRYGSGTSLRGHIKDRVSIDHRPEVVDLKVRVGDWECDTVIGQQGGKVLVTLVERKTRYTLMGISENKSSQAVTATIVNLMEPISMHVLTMTYDNGKEFAEHRKISDALKAEGYFAHPYHSWERGLNENTNGLIRQYLPKGMSFNSVDDQEVQNIKDALNNRPRKCLNFKTPNQELFGINPPIALAS